MSVEIPGLEPPRVRIPRLLTILEREPGLSAGEYAEHFYGGDTGTARGDLRKLRSIGLAESCENPELCEEDGFLPGTLYWWAPERGAPYE